MRRIANTNELQSELRRILAYAQSGHPSRTGLAAALEDLSVRLGETASVRSASESLGQDFHDLMKEEWAHVEYNDKTRRGSVRAGSLGTVHWVESGSDAAVIVTIERFPRIKAHPEAAAQALEAIAKIVNDTSD